MPPFLHPTRQRSSGERSPFDSHETSPLLRHEFCRGADDGPRVPDIADDDDVLLEEGEQENDDDDADGEGEDGNLLHSRPLLPTSSASQLGVNIEHPSLFVLMRRMTRTDWLQL